MKFVGRYSVIVGLLMFGQRAFVGVFALVLALTLGSILNVARSRRATSLEFCMPSLAVLFDGIAGAIAIFFSVLLSPLIWLWRLRWDATGLAE